MLDGSAEHEVALVLAANARSSKRIGEILTDAAGKKIWDSKAGGSLMKAMLGQKPLDEKDKETLAELKQTSQAQSTTQTSPSKATHSKT